jgi:glycosyltransferase involved in cell wall biosynthesis
MHIAFYAPMKPPTHPNPSGDRRMARLLMQAWEGAGHRVELASKFRSYDRGDVRRQEKIRDTGRKLADRLIRRYRARPKVQQPELWFTYHLYHKAPDWLGPAVCAALDIPYLVAEASYAPKQAGGPWDLGHRASAESLAKAARIIGLNRADGDCLLPLLDKPDRQLMAPPFIDTTPYQQAMPDRPAHRRALSKHLGLDEQTPLLLSVAMMRSDQKLLSYQLLGKALQNIMDRPWQLLVAGSGPALADVEKALSPLADRVSWLGSQQENALIPLYAGTDLFVWPAIKEAYGMVFLEALSAGLPVVAGRSAGVEGIVTDNRNGLLVPLGDADAFSDAVAYLLDDSSLLSSMSVAGHMDMIDHHGMEKMSKLLGQLAHEVLT